MPRPPSALVVALGAILLLSLMVSCKRSAKTPTAHDASAATPTPPKASSDTTLVVVQSQFKQVRGAVVPGAAKMTLLRNLEGPVQVSSVEDEGSNVFHKALPWRGGILTIGAMGAKLRHWTRDADTWRARTLWEGSWGGKFDRLRDIEIGDVNGDQRDEIVIGTHDQGVVAVGTEAAGGWSFVQLGKTADTFIHEIEIGDVDGDRNNEFYCTPSAVNRASFVSQGGGVHRYDWDGARFRRSVVVSWERTHAKEILVADLDQDGVDELYIVREAETRREGEETQIVVPVTILQLRPSDDGWDERVIATIDDKQVRFLVPGDVDGDGKLELVAASMGSGLWLLEATDAGAFTSRLIDVDSGGYEHATYVADLDDDGVSEIYVAADRQRKIRRYRWRRGDFERTDLMDIPPQHITWNITALRP